MQTDATTPNIAGRRRFGRCEMVLAVVSKRMHINSRQCKSAQCILGRIRPLRFRRALQTDPTLLRYASAIMEQDKCWELLAQKCDQFQTTPNNTQQNATEWETDAKCNTQLCTEPKKPVFEKNANKGQLNLCGNGGILGGK